MSPIEKAERGLPLTPKEIKNFRQTFEEYPRMFPQGVSDAGEGFLNDALYKHLDCGCRVTGNGSIPFPLTVKLCAKHSAVTGTK